MSEPQTMDADLDRVLQWLSEVWQGICQPPAGLNWLGLAEISPNLALKTFM